MTGGVYVAIAGPIAVGKTTLAGRLAERWGWSILREQFDRNPFLEPFYRGTPGLGLATELHFLFSRFEQLRTTPPPGPGAAGPLLTDYVFAKGLLFAARTLTGDEQGLYRRLFDLLAGLVRPPDAIVYLTDRTDRLLERVRRRGRPMEQGLGADYLDPLREAYVDFYRDRAEGVLRIDCLRDDPLSDAVIGRIEAFVAALPARPEPGR